MILDVYCRKTFKIQKITFVVNLVQLEGNFGLGTKWLNKCEKKKLILLSKTSVCL